MRKRHKTKNEVLIVRFEGKSIIRHQLITRFGYWNKPKDYLTYTLIIGSNMCFSIFYLTLLLEVFTEGTYLER